MLDRRYPAVVFQRYGDDGRSAAGRFGVATGMLARFVAENLVKEAADLVGHRCVFIRLFADHFHAAAVDGIAVDGCRYLDVVAGHPLAHEFGFDSLCFGIAVESGNKNLGHDFTFHMQRDCAGVHLDR